MYLKIKVEHINLLSMELCICGLVLITNVVDDGKRFHL